MISRNHVILCVMLVSTLMDECVAATVLCESVSLDNGGLVGYNRTAVQGRYPLYTVASFHCYGDHTLSGVSKSSCSPGGVWDQEKPTCNIITCPALSLQNGHIHYGNRKMNGTYQIHTTAYFSCYGGYHLVGASQSTCEHNGWDQNTPRCDKNISSTGYVRYSEIITFLEKEHRMILKYWSITTLCNKTLTLSENHLLYARKSCNDIFNPVYAGSIYVGNEVLVKTNEQLIPAEVVNVSILFMQGAHVPLTKEGNIIVDGLLASCYPSSLDHHLAHLSMGWVRWFPDVMQMIFGEDDGISAFVKINKYLET